MALGLSDLLSWSAGPVPGFGGPVDYVNFHLAGGQILPCVQFGVYFLTEGDARLVVLVAGPNQQMGPRQQQLRVEAVGTSREAVQSFLTELAENMARLNVYRGHVISLAPGQMGMGPQPLVAFHTLPQIERDDVVLPAGLLERIERQTAGFSEQAERLLAAGRSLKRGLLLYGPPGVGKTLTIMYLARRMEGRTVILTTGGGLGLLRPVAQMARTLAPSMVVLEDVDLIAEERGNPFRGTGPLLFELLNEMDGLRDDCDVIFVLTTNRADILEPALAARPGRIDLAVELPLPDAEGRRRLLALYARGLATREVDWEAIVARSEGVSPAYIKELLRKAALIAASSAESGELIVTGADLDAAMEELNQGGQLAQRILGFRPAEPGAEPHRPSRPTGFPTWAPHP